MHSKKNSFNVDNSEMQDRLGLNADNYHIYEQQSIVVPAASKTSHENALKDSQKDFIKELKLHKLFADYNTYTTQGLQTSKQMKPIESLL